MSQAPLRTGRAMPIFFTSDTHFGDAGRIRVDKRPFASVAEQDAALIGRWNGTVGSDGEIYHLGDFANIEDVDRVTELLAALSGRKHLIIGNNDFEGHDREQSLGERRALRRT
jgi:calcineurin-like phosphoesterase family protein